MVEKKNRCCDNCSKLIAIGEGGHLCEEDPTMMVLDDYTATEDYFWCEGRCWVEK